MNSAQPSGKWKTPHLSSSPSALFIPLIPSLSLSLQTEGAVNTPSHPLLLQAPCPLSSPSLSLWRRLPQGSDRGCNPTSDNLTYGAHTPPPPQAGASPPAVKRFGQLWVRSVHEYPASPENPTCRVAKKRWGERAESCAGRTGARGWRHRGKLWDYQVLQPGIGWAHTRGRGTWPFSRNGEVELAGPLPTRPPARFWSPAMHRLRNHCH